MSQQRVHSTTMDSNLSLCQYYLHRQGSLVWHPGPQMGPGTEFHAPWRCPSHNPGNSVRIVKSMYHREQHSSIDFSSIHSPIRIHAIETSCQADRGADGRWTSEWLWTEKSISECFHNTKNRWRATQRNWRRGPGVFPEQTAGKTLSWGLDGIPKSRSNADSQKTTSRPMSPTRTLTSASTNTSAHEQSTAVSSGLDWSRWFGPVKFSSSLVLTYACYKQK